MRSQFVLGAVALGALLCLPAVTQAQDYRLPPTPSETGEGIELTPWLRAKPFVRHTSYYTTNVDQAPNRRKDDDFTFATHMGMDLRAENDEGDSWFEAGYTLTSLLYAENGRYDTFEHRARYDFQLTASKVTFCSNGRAAWTITNSDPQFAGRTRNFGGNIFAGVDWDPTDVFGFRVDGDVGQVENFPRQLEPINNYQWRGGAFAVIKPNVDFDLQFEFGGQLRGFDYYDKDATNPDIDAGGVLAGVRVGTEIIQFEARGGIEFAWVSSRRSFPRSSSVPDPFYGNMSLTFTPIQTLTITGFASHELRYSGNGFFQRATTFGGTVEQRIPVVEGLRVFASANYNLQDGKRGNNLRTQSYLGGIGWEIVEYVEIGTQATYIRSSSRSGGFETFTAGGSITLKL